MNEQDRDDIKEIRDLEIIAKIREKEDVIIDEQFILEDDDFLLPEEIRQKGITLFKKRQDSSFLLLKDSTYDDEKESEN